MGKAPHRSRGTHLTWQFRMGRSFFRRICQMAGGFVVYGKENVPATGGALLCGNHISYFDPPLMGSAVFPRRTYFMAKKELFDIPLIGPFIYHSYAFPVDREGNDRQAIRFAIELLRDGELLVVFPEGQRSPDGSLQPGNLGPALMASKAGVPILPIALYGTNHVLPLHAKFVHRGKVQMDIGEPIDPREFGGERLTREQLAAMTEKLMAAIYELQQRQHERVGKVAPPRVKELVHAE